MTKELSIVGDQDNKNQDPKRKGTTTNLNIKKIDFSFDVQKMRRQNTEDLLKAKQKPLIPKSPAKKINNLARMSVSNISLMSIQRDINTSKMKLNNLIAKSPTIARNTRKSSFMNRLPEALK